VERVDERYGSRHGLELFAEDFAIEKLFAVPQFANPLIGELSRKELAKDIGIRAAKRTAELIFVEGDLDLRKQPLPSQEVGLIGVGENTVDIKDHGMRHGRHFLGGIEIQRAMTSLAEDPANRADCQRGSVVATP
jgi:hypothetical protein